MHVLLELGFKMESFQIKITFMVHINPKTRGRFRTAQTGDWRFFEGEIRSYNTYYIISQVIYIAIIIHKSKLQNLSPQISNKLFQHLAATVSANHTNIQG